MQQHTPEIDHSALSSPSEEEPAGRPDGQPLDRAALQRTLGPKANALLDQFIELFGQQLAERLIRWVMSHQQRMPANAPADASIMRNWLVALIRAHRNELTDLLDAELGRLIDALLAKLAT